MGRPAIDLTGQRFGRLTVARRAAVTGGTGRHAQWEAVCDCGMTTVTSSSNLRNGRTRSCGCLAREVARDLLAQDQVKYVGAHGRVYRAKGKASEHPCVACGVPAQQWAYDHADPDERSGTVRDSRGVQFEVRYSMDPSHYRAMCTSCHVRFDRNHAKEEVAA